MAKLHGGSRGWFSHGEAAVDRGGGRSCRRRRAGTCLLRGRRERVYSHWGDVSDCGSLDVDRHYQWSSSSDDVGADFVSKRRRLLDDALFDFFSKEAIKSLKRDFSRFCRDSEISTENKRTKISGLGKGSFFVYSVKYFFEVLHRLTGQQKSIIEKFGFGCLLFLRKTYMPSSFIRWLAWCVDTDSSQIIIEDKILNLSEKSIHFVLGLPSCGAEVVENSGDGLDFIMSMFHLSEVPHITFFGDKLNSGENLTDKEVFVCFMQVAVSCFLCPSANARLDTRYILQLGDCERASGYNVCQLVYKHLILGVNKTINFIKAKGRNQKAFEFCSYALAVYYLDCLDFGVLIAGSGLPRVVSWCGDMIKTYAELDRKSKRGFGRRHIRKDLASCYYNGLNVTNANDTNCGRPCESIFARHKGAMHDKFGLTLSGQTIDGIIETVHSFYYSELHTSNKPDILVQNILQFLADARPWYKSGNHVQKDGVGNISVAKIGSSSIHESGNCKLNLNDPETPDFAASKLVDKDSIITAPEMHPVTKVKSRLNLRLPDKHCVKSDNNCQSEFCQADLISPIGRINLSPSPGCKEESKLAGKSVMHNLLTSTPKGSKRAPIPIEDTTPKAVLDRKLNKSPEVTITGTSSFEDRQNKLASFADAVYNRTVHPNSSNVSHSSKKTITSLQAIADVVQVADDDNVIDTSVHTTGKRTSAVNGLITLQPKNDLVFPLAQNSRFRVSDNDIMHYCAIVELAYKERIQKNYALMYHGVHCSFVSLGQTLMRDGHIDNFLIPCFCRKLFEDNHPTKSGRHYFFSYIGESILDLSSPMHENLVRTSFLGAASASRGKRLDFSDRLFFPICHLDHWFTFVVDFKWKLFAFLDSFYGPKSDYQIAVQGPLMKNFAYLWKKIFETDEPDFKKFQLMTPNMPRQGNVHDCGVFSMKTMEIFDPTKDLRKEFSKDDVGHIRIQYANQLFFHKGNKVDRSIVTDYFEKDDFMRQLHR